MMDGITHAIATCDRIERGLTDAAGRAKHALAEMQIELQNMLDAINADRAVRGRPLWTSRCRGFPNERATILTIAARSPRQKHLRSTQSHPLCPRLAVAEQSPPFH